MTIGKDQTDRWRKRRSIRLQEYDYSQAGAYYIIVCTRDRESLFGNVLDGQMHLNDAGQIIQAAWNGLPQFYEGIELDVFIIMPNHVHGVIVLRAGVGAIHESPLQSIRESSAPMPITDRRQMCCQR
jgi:putative transposase